MKRFNAFAITSLVFAFTVMCGGVAGAVPVITNGLVAAYEFTGNANDTSGSGHHGVVNGATLTTDRFGNPNSAYSFDGISDFVSIDAHISGYSEFTQLAWIESASPVSLGETRILQIGIGGMMLDTALNELIFEIQADRDGGASNGSSPSTRYVYQLTAPDSASGWNQLALTGHSDHSFSLYINGSQVYSGVGLTDGGQVGNYDNSLIGAGNRSQIPQDQKALSSPVPSTTSTSTTALFQRLKFKRSTPSSPNPTPHFS